MKEREAFNFYKSYFDVLNMLDREEQLDFLIALLEKQFYGLEPSLKGQSLFAYVSQKHSIDKQVEGWENKTKSKLKPPIDYPKQPPYLPPTEPPTEDPTQPPYQQEQGKGQEKEEGEVEVEGQGQQTTTLKSYSFIEEKPSNDDMEIFTIMFVEFGEPDSLFDELFDLWNKLDFKEQNDSIALYPKYIKYQTSRKKKLSLFFYLKDKKWNWTTIRNQ